MAGGDLAERGDTDSKSETGDIRTQDLCPRYEIRIAGRLDETAAAAFGGLNVSACGGVTVVRGKLDQAALHGVLELIRSFGLDLVDVRRVRSPACDDSSWPGMG